MDEDRDGVDHEQPAARTFSGVDDFLANARPGDVLDFGVVYRCPPVEPPAPRRSWWKRWTRRPNV